MAPGEIGQLRVCIETAGKRGTVRKEVRIHSNDASLPVQSLFVQVEVVHGGAGAPTREGGVSPLFRAPCDGCHARPAAGLRGGPLYDAVCAMCHGAAGRSGSAKPLAGLQATRVASLTADGDPDAGMPGFAEARGGPLDEGQVRSLVLYLAKP